MFPPFTFSFLPEFAPGLVALIITAVFVAVTFANREHLYSLLAYSLETNSVFMRIIGDLIGLGDAFLKAKGINFLLNSVAVSVLPNPAASVVMLAIGIYLSRYWIYPACFKAVNTKSRTDDSLLVGDVSVRGVGVFQSVLQGLPSLSSFLPVLGL